MSANRNAPTEQDLADLAAKLRIHSITSTDAAKSGHPTSCASIADIMSVLFYRSMRYNPESPRDASSDRFVLSKGHAAPILYAAFAEAGTFDTSLLMNLRKIDSDLEGHPTPRLPFIDVGTGSLGQGLAVACGMAYVGKYFDRAPYRVYCVVGDGEAAEGSIWESLHFASHYKLNNLCVIFDINRLGQSEPTSLQHDMMVYHKRMAAFGMNTLTVDGHDIGELCKAFDQAEATTALPTAIVCKTYKGRGFVNIEDMENWHGKALGAQSDKILANIKAQIKNFNIKASPQRPLRQVDPVNLSNVKLSQPPQYKEGEMVATRLSYGLALKKIGDSNPRVIALDGDTKNSTFSDKLKAAHPDNYIECFIAEQNLVGVAIGAACRDRTIAFVSTFAAFFTRAFDQIRMGAISQTNINLAGSHCGVSIGEDGPSQMGLEDLALFRTIPSATVFYPSDGVSCEKSVEIAANTKGICYIRTSRPNTALIYPNNEEFQIGVAKVVRQTASDHVLLIGAGVTLHEALEAHNILKPMGINARVLDPFTIKPLDVNAILKNANACGGRIVVVEDHYYAGGLGEAVMAAVAMDRNIIVKHLAVGAVPRSGPPTVLLDMFGISAKHIVDAAQQIVKL